MTTTTGDPSTLKTPASLSGGDLVSRLLAATPPYLYNVPLTPNSFFFSEMLRSFVQANKAETSSVVPVPGVPRRRKRSWRDTRDRPLELTTKERSHHQTHQSHQQAEKYFHTQQQQQHQYQHQQQHILDSPLPENQSKSLEPYDLEGKNLPLSLEQKASDFSSEILKVVDENRSEFKPSKNYFADRIPNQQESIFSNKMQKVKPEDSEAGRNCTYSERNNLEDRSSKTNNEVPFLTEQKNKLDFSARNFLPCLTGRSDELQSAVKGFGLPSGNVPNPEFLPNPLWYPPYPMSQSYPGFDPLPFFIDLRVSGHIYDRKLNERQLTIKSKHNSAFSVPQGKEYNRPLNLTRDEAASVSRSNEENHRGTHYILKHITRTYQDIKESEKESGTEITEVVNEESQKSLEADSESSKKEESSSSSSNQEEGKKDLRALIGLELVVDYVKEPKGESCSERSPQITE